jgi:type I restriction enzyme S subunit
VTGLPLLTPENISKGTGAILDGFGKAEDAGSNKFVFSAGTILYSRIRPYFQKVTIAPFDGVCSTEIYPLVPCKLVEPKYLLEILLSKDFTRYAVSGMKGTGFPRVSHDYIAKYPISIPSLSHQQTYLSFAIPLRQFDYLAQRRIIEIQAVKTSIIEEVF